MELDVGDYVKPSQGSDVIPQGSIGRVTDITLVTLLDPPVQVVQVQYPFNKRPWSSTAWYMGRELALVLRSPKAAEEDLAA